MKTINKHTLLKQVRKTGKWEGFVCGNKANPEAFGGALRQPIRIELAQMYDRPAKYVVTTQGQRVDLTKWLNEWSYYQPSELGKIARFWE